MFVECQKYDPTNPVKPDGTPQFYLPYPGAQTNN